MLRVIGGKRSPMAYQGRRLSTHEQPHLVEFSVKASRKLVREGGKLVPAPAPNYLPESYAQPLHPGGNSLCYMIQHAHLWGAGEIRLLGFTLQPGTPYFFGRDNPITGKPSFYRVDRALPWLQWFEHRFPGRVTYDPASCGGIVSTIFREWRDG